MFSRFEKFKLSVVLVCLQEKERKKVVKRGPLVGLRRWVVNEGESITNLFDMKFVKKDQ